MSDVTLSDVQAVRRLEKAAFPRDAYDTLTITAMAIRPGNVNLKVADEAGQVVGHVTGSPRPLFGTAWIVTLAVAPTHHRRGIGRALLATCEQRLDQPLIRLTVRVSNAPAIALYKQMGYQSMRVQRRYYRGGEDGIVMEKQRP
jgi:ribosomal protein S18 acetylase RimI-like enzyme